MKVTIGQLRHVIREEIARSLGNQNLDEGFFDKIKSMFGGDPARKEAGEKNKDFYNRIDAIDAAFEEQMAKPQVKEFMKSPRGKELESAYAKHRDDMEKAFRAYETKVSEAPKDRTHREKVVRSARDEWGPRLAKAESVLKEILAAIKAESMKPYKKY